MPNHDKKTISNQFNEMNHVAKKFDIEVWRVYKVKADLKTNNRLMIYNELSNIYKTIVYK